MASNGEHDFHSNWRALATIQIPLKRFIPEGKAEEVNTCQKSKESNFHNNSEEIKEFYDEICQMKQRLVTKPKKSKRQSVPIKKASAVVISEPFDQKKFFNFATTNNIDEIKKMRVSHNEKNARDLYGWTALMMAACGGAEQVVEYLLEQEADTTVKDKSGKNAADLAQLKGHKNIVRLLQSSQNYNKYKSNTPAQSPSPIIPFYCDICKAEFKATTRIQHETSTIHQFNSKSNFIDKMPKFNLSNKNRGLNLMVKQGWNKDSGLGPTQSGRLYPIKTVLRKDRTGLGIEQDAARVTHFMAFDKRAIERRKLAEQRQKNRNEMRREKLREQKREKRLRQELS